MIKSEVLLNCCMSHHDMHDPQLDACSIQPKKGMAGLDLSAGEINPVNQ